MKRKLFNHILSFFLCTLLLPGVQNSLSAKITAPQSCFDIASDGAAVPLYISQQDFEGAQRAMGDLQQDLQKLTRNQVQFISTGLPHGDKFVLAGTIGKSPEIDQLIETGKLDASFLEGAWEAYEIKVIENAFDTDQDVLVIAGSDMRGTIYGIYEISRQMGVSPWHFWADVPVPHKENISVLPDCELRDKPLVQYRGIFLNDENPALYGWVHETYGGFNHEFYSDVFELILRLKGNYLWTAMWGKAFYDDDPLNAPTAEQYGVVIGTTHHEPMGRAHVEWDRYGEGEWNYQTNEEFLKDFWTTGIQRLGDYEATITLGMRGDGDMAMSDETNTELLERIVDDQRKIIEEHSQQHPEKELQLWALYKEVQEYYEKGMRTPDDVMLLLCDDNWGNVRLLPDPGKADQHPGGWGMYYHFDYVGGPRNYKWINTNQISRTWEQMNLAWEHGVKRMWLVNVGDLKPMEFPISFFLDHAWDPEEMTIEAMNSYPEQWASDQFGPEHSKKIGHFLTRYSLYNSRRKPEMLSPETYSLIHFNEADRIVSEYNQLYEEARALQQQIGDEYQDAYYQLVLHPIEASANLNELYVSAAKNHWYAEQGRAATNLMAETVQKLFDRDQEITDYYHHEMADGKWNHMMSQTHIGYTYWQQPDQNNIPETRRIEVPEKAGLGVSIPGSAESWPKSDAPAVLPVFDKFNQQEQKVTIFNTGKNTLKYTVETREPWINIGSITSNVELQEDFTVSVNWEEAPAGKSETPIIIKGAGTEVEVIATIFNPETDLGDFSGFVEANGYVSMKSVNYSRKRAGETSWTQVPQLGRLESAMTPFPVTTYGLKAGTEESPRLEYDMYLFTEGDISINLQLSPTLEFNQSEGLKFAVSLDDEEPEIININEDYNWYQIVGDNINVITAKRTIKEAGAHTLKIWAIDPGVVVQNIVVKTGEIGGSYLGPPQSFQKNVEVVSK